jgi:hypothetical protein
LLEFLLLLIALKLPLILILAIWELIHLRYAIEKYLYKLEKKKKNLSNFSAITYDNAIQFKKEFKYGAAISIATFASFASTLNFQSNKTNPNVQVLGTDESYLATSGYELGKGRNLLACSLTISNL